MPLDATPIAPEPPPMPIRFDTSPKGLVSAPPWYAVVSKPRQEERAKTRIAEQGFEVYLPICRDRRRDGTEFVGPLFPRYLFIRPIPPVESVKPIFSTPGVAFMLRGDTGKLLTLRNAEIQDWQDREADDGIINLIPPAKGGMRYDIGTELRVTVGPFTGFTGRFEGMGAQDRVRVLLSLFGRPTPVQVAQREVEEVG